MRELIAAACGVAGAVLCGTAEVAPSRAEPAARGVRSEPVDAVLDDFHDAASKADFDRYFSHWTDTSVFLGTDDWERWVGGQFRDFARPHFVNGTGWSYTPRDRRVSLSADGSVAWFDERLSNAKLGTCRGSGVLAKVGGEWKVMQYNLSVPIPNELVEDVARRITEHRRAR